MPKINLYTFKGSKSASLFLPALAVRVNLLKKDLAFLGAFLEANSIREDTIWKVLLSREAIKESQKLFPF